MVSLFGRGFDSLQLHMQKKDHLTAAFLSYVEHVSSFYFATQKRSLRSLGGPPGPLFARGLARPNTFERGLGAQKGRFYLCPCDNNPRCKELLGYRYQKPWPPVGL